mmetsp:Transcript_21153/g.64439  ORF Transcript_21153/g.64439 Transcript_21153/m.64439 type:complete len:88 (+) Transcript_21153:103-366(+)|eukprot:CAMPEP_0118853822 /NCGR_PEP_ID=MMETSP1163-20130328/2269_1 /TAXON_ID=124430 /ORGANISM="Phaeomonas parva, Strain CCMP2877" /LENGTH=87 /DNA_ID=CAMNT_0006786437 /DNA_START=94 /DNA_END=357 /DNA_ORIENTATION=-
MPGRSDVKMKEYPAAMLENPQTTFEKMNALEVKTREAAVTVAELKLLQAKVQECYFREGVNHFQNCEHLAREYMNFIMSEKFRKADP